METLWTAWTSLKDYKENFAAIASIISIFTFISGIIILRKGSKQYRVAQTWKRNEFLANEIKEFNNDSEVKDTIKMLDSKLKARPPRSSSQPSPGTL